MISDDGSDLEGEPMFDFQAWYSLVLEVLEGREERALALIRAVAPSGASGGLVELMEGPTTGLDALAYARVLLELGRRVEAEEVVLAVIRAEWAIPAPQAEEAAFVC